MPPAKGYKQGDEHKRKRAEAWVGRQHSPESRAKMSAAARRRAADRPRGDAHPSWIGEDAGYKAAHLRLRQARGRAADSACIDCGSQAAHWSLATERASAIIERGGQSYSLDVQDYDPRCVSCHRLHDRVAA